MSDLVGNLENRFSHDEAHINSHVLMNRNSFIYKENLVLLMDSFCDFSYSCSKPPPKECAEHSIKHVLDQGRKKVQYIYKSMHFQEKGMKIMNILCFIEFIQ